MLRKAISCAVSAFLVWMSAASAFAGTNPPPTLDKLINKSYVELLENPPSTSFSPEQFNAAKKKIQTAKNSDRNRLESEERQLKSQAGLEKKKLEALEKDESLDAVLDRTRLRSKIDDLEDQIKAIREQRDHGLRLTYDNEFAKLDLIRDWPAKEREIRQNLLSHKADQRRFANVQMIGTRVIANGQENDLPVGENAMRDMRDSGTMPPELNDPELNDYVQKLAEKIADNSDLRVPVKATVLDSDEINAFSLPGGFLFVNRGLIEKTDNESELAGVMAHELAHVAARHGSRLMKRAQIANIVYQGAQVAAVMLTGGAVTAATYYAMQYGFYGLGLAMNIALLGVSREYESEADQLGVQYTWKAGYDPMGFTRFFDKMANQEGYVRSASFFRTHPPFFNRILSTYSEIEYLGPKPDAIVDSDEFDAVKEKLEKEYGELEHGLKNRPVLRRDPGGSGEGPANWQLLPGPWPLTPNFRLW